MSHLAIACDLLQRDSQSAVNQGNIPTVWEVQMRQGNLKNRDQGNFAITNSLTPYVNLCHYRSSLQLFMTID